MIEIRSCKFFDPLCQQEGVACSECMLRHLDRACSLADVRHPDGSYGHMLRELWFAVIQRIARDGASGGTGWQDT